MVDERCPASAVVVAAAGDDVVAACDEANAGKRKERQIGKDLRVEEERRNEIGGEDELDFVH